MPRFRPDLAQLPPYQFAPSSDGASVAEIARLASNECPTEPFPEVKDALTTAIGEVNRYPDDSCSRLATALAERHGVTREHIWLGAGTTQLLGAAAWAMGGPGTTAIYADPSFAMYRIYTALAGSTGIPIPLDSAYRHDPSAILGAIRDDTTLVFVCNPHNPTGTYLPGPVLAGFIAEVPDRTLIVVDEAYLEYATAADFASALPSALERDNVIVTRTFSKVYGLAGLRVGYAVGSPRTLSQLRVPQAPFSVGHLGQVAALASLGCDGRLAERIGHNATERAHLEAELAERGIEYSPSQANFVFLDPADPVTLGSLMREAGVLVRSSDRWLRATVGTVAENRAFIGVLDSALARSKP